MVHLVAVTVLVVALASLVVTQPFTQDSDAAKHTDFKWNSRKIGNKKVATLTIRKDEERDRRSIPLADVDDDTLSAGQRRHHHRHHHGEETRSSVWLADRSDADRRHREEGTARLTPLYLAESSLEDRNLMQPRLNDVRPGTPIHEESQNNFQEVLDAAGFHLSFDLAKNATQKASARRHNHRSGKRPRKTSNENINTKAKRRRRKSSKNCRRLKGKKKKRCRAAQRKCRHLRGRERKRCRANAVDDSSPDIFSFIKGKNEMFGQDACHYKYLKECSRKVGMLTDTSGSRAAVVKCHYREEFLKCMEEQRMRTCDPGYKIRGNMKAMRNKIREVVWTPSSCLISEVIEG